MVIVHNHTLFVSPNNSAAQAYIERMKSNLEGSCTVKESTVGISIEWSEVTAVTTAQEGFNERT